ncbi:MAG: lecithin retinol acyltransferase family protein [Desulfobacterales bacterium]
MKKTDIPEDDNLSAHIIEADLVPGDHIYVKRDNKFYSHHGIYMGGGRVVHFAGSLREKVDPVVHEITLAKFLRGGAIRRRYHRERLPSRITLQLAGQQLTEESFSMVWNNCEHFATYCATGKKTSWQVRNAIYGVGTVAAGIALFALTRIILPSVKKT